MIVFSTIALVGAFGLLAYLGYALAKPEKYL